MLRYGNYTYSKHRNGSPYVSGILVRTLLSTERSDAGLALRATRSKNLACAGDKNHMASRRSALFAMRMLALVVMAVAPAVRQQSEPSSSPVIVQPGAPGQENKTLTAKTAKPDMRPPSKADIDFMQGMIMHHNQAVEMTELLKTRSQDAQVRELGKKIDVSQTDEMRWMKQWLTDRGLPVSAPMDMGGMDMPGMDMSSMMPAMPGMLTSAQMNALRKASGPTFDHLFLTGMIQHHTGALTMVKQLFANPGAGQDPQLFDFASDVDNTQQAEIDSMQHILKEKK